MVAIVRSAAGFLPSVAVPRVSMGRLEKNPAGRKIFY
jgi:hypothetical protein